MEARLDQATAGGLVQFGKHAVDVGAGDAAALGHQVIAESAETGSQGAQGGVGQLDGQPQDAQPQPGGPVAGGEIVAGAKGRGVVGLGHAAMIAGTAGFR